MKVHVNTIINTISSNILTKAATTANTKNKKDKQARCVHAHMHTHTHTRTHTRTRTHTHTHTHTLFLSLSSQRQLYVLYKATASKIRSKRTRTHNYCHGSWSKPVLIPAHRLWKYNFLTSYWLSCTTSRRQGSSSGAEYTWDSFRESQ